MAKRKGQGMLDRVSKMAKASAALEEEKSVSFSPMVAESKEEYFDRVCARQIQSISEGLVSQER